MIRRTIPPALLALAIAAAGPAPEVRAGEPPAPPPSAPGDVALVVAPVDLLVEGLKERYAPGEPLSFRVRVPKANVVRAAVEVAVLKGRGDGATPVHREVLGYDRFSIGDNFPIEVRLPAAHQTDDLALLVRVEGLREEGGDLEPFEEHFTYNLAWDAFGGVRADASVRLPERLLFASDRYALTAEHAALLDRVAAAVKATRDLDHVLVEGHADRVGGAEYNLELSRKRALAAVAYLADKGVPRDRIRHLAFGFTHPYVEIAGAPGRASAGEDRRVQFVVFRAEPEGRAR